MLEVKHGRLRKGIKWTMLTLVGLVAIILLIAPIIIIQQATKGPVQYLGYATEDYPMQDIYTAEEFGLTAKQQHLATEDDIRVWISEIEVDSPKGVVIYLSGIQQPSVTYFYGHSKWLKERDFASILLEVRGHGQSEGNRVALGYEEVADVQAVVDYIKAQEKYSEAPIILHGVSMGGAIAINAFGQIPEIDGLIAMSAYSGISDVAYEMMLNYGVPSYLALLEKSLVEMYLPFFFNESVEWTPIKQIQNVGQRPAFLIACTGDTEVLPSNMERLLSVAPNHTESWLRDSWEHFIVKDSDFKNMAEDQEYCDRILRFIEKVAAKAN